MNRREFGSILAGAVAATPVHSRSGTALTSYCASRRGSRQLGTPSLLTLCTHPLLKQKIYRFWPGGKLKQDGAAGRNINGMTLIEEQRGGGEYVLSGVISGNVDWRRIGWQVIDWGNAQQQPDGSFLGHYETVGGKFHSTTIFLHSVELACMADPSGVNRSRLRHLHSAATWLVRNKECALLENSPFNHRMFLSMSVIGRAAFITGDKLLNAAAVEFAERGLSAQLPGGINPEAGGFDVSYQMVGPFQALLFLPVCPDLKLACRLEGMCKRAIDWWCSQQREDGSVTVHGSTRVGRERQTDGKTLKQVNYNEIVRTLVWAYLQLGDINYLDAAYKASRHL